jgi:hypothetical protein
MYVFETSTTHSKIFTSQQEQRFHLSASAMRSRALRFFTDELSLFGFFCFRISSSLSLLLLLLLLLDSGSLLCLPLLRLFLSLRSASYSEEWLRYRHRRLTGKVSPK